MTTQEKMDRYQEAVERWLRHRHDHPAVPHDKPKPKDYGFDCNNAEDNWVVARAEAKAALRWKDKKL